MSWIKQNKVLAGLIACTLVLCAVLLYVGSIGGSRYQDLLDEFRAADNQVVSYERLKLYPDQANLDGKTKALADYEESITTLKEKFEKFRKPAPARISPQEFSDRLVATHEQITSRLNAANVELPEGFYSGFEGYTQALAQSGATPVLTRQLESVDGIFANLAAARPSQLINFLRIRQPEEQGGNYQPDDGAVARPHAFELTFRGTEASARRFISSLADTDERLVVIRTLRIRNEKSTAPQSSSAQFATATAPATAETPFDGGFFGSFDDFLDEGDDAEPVLDNGDAVPAPPPAPQGGGSRMLAQVAGNEQVEVFIRFDVMEFPAQSNGDADDES